MEGLFILLLALLIDLVFGEPPRVTHPVVWMGKIISFCKRFTPVQGKHPQVIYGSVMVLLTIFIFTSPVYFLLSYARQVSPLAYVLIGALLLKPSFSFRELRQTALKIKLLLTKGNIEEARSRMPALVSRETQNMGEPEVVSATVESVAENTCDSIVAPLFYFLLFGVPGAVVYRVVNTWDAMIGYHGKYEYSGKFAAKLDDVLNFIPARITGLLLVMAAYLCRKDGKNAWRVMLRDHGNTESPNAGWPMSAAAGALRTQLQKAGCYSLGNINNPLSPELIASGIKLAQVATVLCVLFYLIGGVTRLVFIT